MRANDLKSGMAVNLDGKLYVVTKTEQTKPGKGPAYIQAKLKDINTGANIEKRFGSTDDVDVTTVDRSSMEFLYQDADGFVFMDASDYEQYTLPSDLLGDDALYLTPNLEVTVLRHEGNPLGVELPSSVEMEITDTPPGIKNATATNQLKEATTETGLKTRVPPFISVGDRVRISTADGSYQSRA